MFETTEFREADAFGINTWTRGFGRMWSSRAPIRQPSKKTARLEPVEIRLK